MAGPRRLVLFVEGEGDKAAVPVLVKRLLTEMGAWSDLFLDPQPFVVGNAADLTKEKGKQWIRFLNAASRRSRLGAVLLVQDGDLGTIRGEPFCAFRFAAHLSEWAKGAGAGVRFSVATVFPCQEYESWILACIDRLAGLPLGDGRAGVRAGAAVPERDLERGPGGGKLWLDKNMDAGYKPARDQEWSNILMQSGAEDCDHSDGWKMLFANSSRLSRWGRSWSRRRIRRLRTIEGPSSGAVAWGMGGCQERFKT